MHINTAEHNSNFVIVRLLSGATFDLAITKFIMIVLAVTDINNINKHLNHHSKRHKLHGVEHDENIIRFIVFLENNLNTKRKSIVSFIRGTLKFHSCY